MSRTIKVICALYQHCSAKFLCNRTVLFGFTPSMGVSGGTQVGGPVSGVGAVGGVGAGTGLPAGGLGGTGVAAGGVGAQGTSV